MRYCVIFAVYTLGRRVRRYNIITTTTIYLFIKDTKVALRVGAVLYTILCAPHYILL